MLVLAIALIVLFGTYNTYAIYRESNTANGTLALASWNVELTNDQSKDSMTLVSGKTNQVYTLTVKNLSEVDIDYTIVISNLPDGVEIKLDDNVGFEEQDSNNTITFVDAGSILYGTYLDGKTHTLEFRSLPGSDEVTNQNINIDVIAKQKL